MGQVIASLFSSLDGSDQTDLKLAGSTVLDSRVVVLDYDLAG